MTMKSRHPQDAVDMQAANAIMALNFGPDGPVEYFGHRLLADAYLHLLFSQLPQSAQDEGERVWSREDLDKHFAEATA